MLFLCLLKYSYYLTLHFVDVARHTDRFAGVKPSLHPCHKPHMIKTREIPRVYG